VTHRLSLWAPLITALEAVDGRCLVSVSPGMVVGRCVWPSRCGRPTSMPWDEPPSLRDVEDCLGMRVVAVVRPDKWTH
jgi:hypothetical protein